MPIRSGRHPSCPGGEDSSLLHRPVGVMGRRSQFAWDVLSLCWLLLPAAGVSVRSPTHRRDGDRSRPASQSVCGPRRGTPQVKCETPWLVAVESRSPGRATGTWVSVVPNPGGVALGRNTSSILSAGALADGHPAPAYGPDTRGVDCPPIVHRRHSPGAPRTASG